MTLCTNMLGNLSLFGSLFLVWISSAVQGQFCILSQTDFVTECTNTYGGVVDGGRCFFLIKQGRTYPTATWYEAWPLCASLNGTMAQIHTSHEFSTVQAYLKGIFGTLSKIVTIALGRVPHLTSTDKGFAMDTTQTHWYDDVSNYNPLLSVGNTWIQAHQTDDLFAPDFNCYHFWGNFTKIGDCACSDSRMPLCTVYNSFQNFSLVTSTENGNCMAETVIQAFTAVPSTADCATYCAGYIWCRGYNYYRAAQKCELFSWYYQDTTKFVSNPDCYHYAYMP